MGRASRSKDERVPSSAELQRESTKLYRQYSQQRNEQRCKANGRQSIRTYPHSPYGCK
uniref:Uncharacterized protein n=1 Tax=Arundo donax TaxID=35708 RepID=A0A0A9F7F5_ARUDO